MALTYWQRRNRLKTLAYMRGLKRKKAEIARNEAQLIGEVLSHARREPLRCRCTRPDGRDRMTRTADHFSECPHSTLWATTRKTKGRR